MERVIVAFESDKNCQHIKDVLESSGTVSCIVCRSAAEVRRLVQKQHITIVVCGYKLPDDSAENLFHDLPQYCAMLIVANQNQLDYCEADIFTLSTPVSKKDLVASVNMLLQMNARIEKFSHPQRSDEDRDLINRAKAVLMERHGMSEDQAHRLLQKKSMDNGAKLADTARLVLGEQ
jgi:AmiR/NasT family two-component response regulator